MILKELGRLIFSGTGRGIRFMKDWELKHVCSEAPESIIHVLEL